MVNLDKALAMSSILNGDIEYTIISYDVLKRFKYTFYTSSLAELLSSLKHQLDWISCHDGLCNSTNRQMQEMVLYRLDTWCLVGMESHNYISLIVAWKRALVYIQEIDKLVRDEVHRNYINRTLFFELDTFLKLTEFILEEVLHE